MLDIPCQGQGCGGLMQLQRIVSDTTLVYFCPHCLRTAVYTYKPEQLKAMYKTWFNGGIVVQILPWQEEYF